MWSRLSNLGFILLIVGLCGGGLILMQLVPYGHRHTNPPVLATPVWDSPRTAELAAKSCFNCHSNETEWPWYAYVAPVSWLIQQDVELGRNELNFSDWNPQGLNADHVATDVYVRHMPPVRYLPLHPSSKLTDQEKNDLADGLKRTIRMAQGKE